ncbi:FAD-dependent oxidoreductase [Cytobacillus sp. IB215316]|uniref:NAD(P)/FAD-dependent oxidoreductase n=1 Tax=Cytobacillus sp. IB215316 TaxID=3097354 RepID=UPI002A135E00|nr:FAD-dependent oxidoreductase [Cytobacillus sp. IB215316]MDX8362593.1 FAD-dependent oxidoreductase [Cytobacillus sp. IB215316]
MDLQSGKFYWPTTYNNPPSYPVLEEDINCDVLIIGGGSSGAQCAYLLSETDLKVAVVDRRQIGQGSTAVNTALIQYLGDKMLFELVNSFGEQSAILHTKLCEEAMNDIEKAAMQMKIDPEFNRRDSLYYASDEEGVEKLNKEYHFLHKHHFHVDLLTERQISERYPFAKKLALHIYDDGEINPYKYTHGLLMESQQRGVQIFERTRINGHKFENGSTTFFTANKHAIKAKHVIIAAGYEGLEFKKEKNGYLTSSYAIVTNPVDDFSGWYNKTLIWETARPYIYMRTTPDGRIIIGGLDENTHYANDRDSKIIHKKKKLVEEFNKLFPNIAVNPDYYLGAFYGGTHDGLPMIGQYEEFPSCYFIYAYGDNGMVYSGVLANILRDVITKGSHPAMELYGKHRASSM